MKHSISNLFEKIVMCRLEKKYSRKMILIFGLTISVIGLILNLTPAEIRSAEIYDDTNIAPYESYNFSIKPIIDISGKDFKIKFSAQFKGKSNLSIIFLNSSEYENYIANDSIENLTTIRILKENYDLTRNVTIYQDSFTISNKGIIHILFLNNEDTVLLLGFNYAYTIIAPIYYLGLIIMSIGVLFTLGVLAWCLNGWKRYFLIGININLSFFFMHIAILPELLIETPSGISALLDILHFELYQDFEFYYVKWVDLFKNGVFPYSEQYGPYSYGPLFIITLGMFNLFTTPIWSPAIPLFLSTIGTGYLVYLISKKTTENEKYSIYAMIFYLVNPFTMLYSSFLWLNPSIFTFFVTLSYYFVLTRKNNFAVISLGIGAMYKQFALVFFPIILLLLIKKKGVKRIKMIMKYVIYYSMIFCFTLLLISLPFLIINFQSYIRSYTGNVAIPIESLITYNMDLGTAVNFNTFFLLVRAPKVITFIIAYALGLYILLFSCLFKIYFYYLENLILKKNIKRSNKNSDFIEAIFLSILIVISIHLFYPRGSYKYYLILLVPFISILFDFRDLMFLQASEVEVKKYKFQKRYLFPLVMSWIIFLAYRYIYFWILIVWIIFYLYLRAPKENKIKKKIDSIIRKIITKTKLRMIN